MEMIGTSPPSYAKEAEDFILIDEFQNEDGGGCTLQSLANPLRANWRFLLFEVWGVNEAGRGPSAPMLFFIPPTKLPIQTPIGYRLNNLFETDNPDSEIARCKEIYKEIVFPQPAHLGIDLLEPSYKTLRTNERGEVRVDIFHLDNKHRQEWRYFILDMRPRFAGFKRTGRENNIYICFIPPFGSDEPNVAALLKKYAGLYPNMN